MKINYLEWNIKSAGNKNHIIPLWIAGYLIKNRTEITVDIIVLTEFRCGKNWDHFKNILEKEYNIFISPYTSANINQVCIALKREKKFKVKSIITENIYNTEIPELLQLNVLVDDQSQKEFAIIGTRIKTQGNKKKEQIAFLNNKLKTLETCLCIGDFNCTNRKLQELLSSEIEVYGPRIVNDYYSFVHKDHKKIGLDWLISKGLKNVNNPYDDQKESPYATYDWEFINKDYGYGDKSKEDYLNIKGLPDHAILLGQFEL